MYLQSRYKVKSQSLFNVQIHTIGRSHLVSFLIGCATPRGVTSLAGGSMLLITMVTSSTHTFERRASLNRN